MAFYFIVICTVLFCISKEIYVTLRTMPVFIIILILNIFNNYLYIYAEGRSHFMETIL